MWEANENLEEDKLIEHGMKETEDVDFYQYNDEADKIRKKRFTKQMIILPPENCRCHLMCNLVHFGKEYSTSMIHLRQ